MKNSLLTLVALSVVLTARGQSCPNVDCSSSVECAQIGGGLNCRCSFFSCFDYGDEKCGGGCFTDTQCSQWSGGEAGCICGMWFECERESTRQLPGYETYAKMMMAIKKDKIAQRLALLTKEMKEQEDAIDERLRML